MSVAGGPGALPGGANSRRASSGGTSDARVDVYLERLRQALAGLSRDATSEILEELRGHILEKAALNGDNCEVTPATIEDVVATLGSPEELAAQYLADDLLERAANSRSPLLFCAACCGGRA